MTDRQRNQLDAAQTTYDYLLQPDHVLIWTPLEAFGEAVVKIEGSLGIIHTLIQLQAGKTEGLTADKDRLRQSVQRRVIVLAKAGISYGKVAENGDLVAQAEAHNSARELEAIADAMLNDHALMLHQRTKEARDANPTLATKYGLKKDAEDTLLAPIISATTAYGAVVGSPRSAIVAKAGATAGIDIEFHRLQSILKDQTDNLIAQFEDDQPTFVRGYFNSRKIIDRHGPGAKTTGGGNGNSTPPPTP